MKAMLEASVEVICTSTEALLERALVESVTVTITTLIESIESITPGFALI